MKRHALVIGASLKVPAEDLAAEEFDAERMAEMLRRYGFEIERLQRAGASRDGILAGYRRLIERVGPGDATVVYFAGNGGMVIDPQAPSGERVLPKRFQFIAPTDYTQSTEDDFRGISAWELSQLLGQLTDRTDNVTVIFDCCFSSQMSRDQAVTGAAVRALPKLTWLTIGKQLDKVRERFGPIGGPGVMGNPKAVRLAACGDWQTAVQTVDEQGRPGGLFTQALIATLEEIGDAPVSWRAIGEAIRMRVLRTITTQRPVVEGPVKRLLFSLTEVDTPSVPISRRGDELRIDAGQIVGVSVGDIYGVTAIGKADFAPEESIAQVAVDRVEALHAIVRPIQWSPGRDAIPPDAVAWPIERALTRHVVKLDVPEPWRTALEAAVASSARLRVATDRQHRVGELRMAGGELRVLTRDGRELEPSSPLWSVPDAIRQLEYLAVAQALVELEGEHRLADEDVEIEWGTVHPGGVRIPRPAHGAALGLGDRIYLRLRNRTQLPRFVHVFNIGLRGRISLLSNFAPSGVRLGPEQEELVGVGPDRDSKANGFQLDWPRDLRRDEPGSVTLLILVTARPVDLRVLETDDKAGARKQVSANESPLQRLMRQLYDGGTRSTAAAAADPFFVVRRSYVLYPLEAPIAGPGFAIDEDPLALVGAARPDLWLGAAIRQAREIEIGLRDLATERAVRIDALVCTRSPDARGVWQAHTLVVTPGVAIADHEILWRGPVQDLVEIYLWVAPAPDGGGGGSEGGGPELAELLAAAARARPAVAEAIGALVVRDPQAPWSLTSGACAALAQAVNKLLRVTVPGIAGLLHTSYVAAEDYGIGRHPASKLYHGLGVTLGLSISDSMDGASDASSAKHSMGVAAYIRDQLGANPWAEIAEAIHDMIEREGVEEITLPDIVRFAERRKFGWQDVHTVVENLSQGCESYLERVFLSAHGGSPMVISPTVVMGQLRAALKYGAKRSGWQRWARGVRVVWRPRKGATAPDKSKQ
jgi:Caspase domain